MKNIIVKILLIVAAISLPYKAMAQDLTEEETTFLKSLSGKWRACTDCEDTFGSYPLDFTIKYFNGYLKIQYSAVTCEVDGVRFPGKRETLSAYYDTSTNSVHFNFKQTFHNSKWVGEEDFRTKYYINIPFQTDIDDSIIIYREVVFESGGPGMHEETMLYKQ